MIKTLKTVSRASKGIRALIAPVLSPSPPLPTYSCPLPARPKPWACCRGAGSRPDPKLTQAINVCAPTLPSLPIPAPFLPSSSLHGAGEGAARAPALPPRLPGLGPGSWGPAGAAVHPHPLPAKEPEKHGMPHHHLPGSPARPLPHRPGRI